MSPKDQKLFRRLKKNYVQFSRIKNHEIEYRIFNVLNKVAIYLNLSKSIKESSAYYYKKILKKEKKILNNISLIASCIYHAGREKSNITPITMQEIADAFRLFGHRVSKRLILRDSLRYNSFFNKTKPKVSEDYLDRLVHDVTDYLNLQKRLEYKSCRMSLSQYRSELCNICRKLLSILSISERGGRSPLILTGAVIYLGDKLLAENHKHKPILTQNIIANASKIPEYSIRDHYVNLLKPLKKDLTFRIKKKDL